MSSAHNHLSDSVAVSLSGLCLAHCLALPLAAAALPALGALSEASWVHLAFLAAAAPASALALRDGAPKAMLLLVGGGLALLAAGSVEWHGHALAESLTVAGSLALVCGHLWNWRRRARRLAAPA